MAKISPSSIKYSIIASFQSEGPLEKPDVIGALFGQTEGLLGSEMELRELQKEGKIGRIDVNLRTEDGKTKGEIIIPSALDKTETTIIAASLETIDKIGPTDAKITINEIEDVRGSKRDYIMERAKQLLGNIKGAGMESQEIEQELRESSRTSKISEYGSEKLPAGDLSGKEVIVVEGRADVVNMLRHGINNVIGMDGAKLPKTIAEISKDKELTLFVDGDRGGNLIAKNVCENAKVIYIAIAPDGKEVEELTGKELLQALRKKVPASEFFGRNERNQNFSRQDRPSFQRRDERPMRDERPQRQEREEEFNAPKSDKKLTKEDRDKLKELSSEIRGKNVLILNEKLNIIRNIPASKVGYLRLSEPAFVLMTNTATNSLIAAAENINANYVAAKTFGKIDNTSVELVSL